MKQLINKKDLIGKTISDIFLTKKNYQDLWIKFDDNSFAVFNIEDITEGFGYTKQVIKLDGFEKNSTNYQLVELGLISKKEYKNAIDKEEKEYDDRCKQDELNRQKEIEEYELKILDNLAKKYNK